MGKNNRKNAHLETLFEKMPDGPGGEYIGVRRWCTDTEDAFDLVVEHGTVDAHDELITKSEVVPFGTSLGDILRRFLK